VVEGESEFEEKTTFDNSTGKTLVAWIATDGTEQDRIMFR
jgi:hypothetical protein